MVKIAKKSFENDKKNRKSLPKKACYNLHDLLSKYHLAHFSSLICISISPQVRICCLSTSKRQMSLFSVPPKSRRHVVLSNKKSVFGQSETHTCGVRQPTNGTDASTHLARSKKNRYGLSMTTLSMPHFRPSVSVGTRTRSKSPFFSAGNRFAVKRGGFIVGIQNTKSNMVENVVKTVIFTEMGDKAPSTKKCDKDQ